MMPRLTLLSYPGLFPADFKVDGRLDLELVDAPRYTRQLMELIDIDQLRVDAYLDLNVFATPKTILALRHSWVKCLTNIQCELAVAGNIFNLTLIVLGEEDDQFIIRLKRPSNYWIEKLNKDSIQDLNLGQFELTLDNITTQWSLGGVYQDLDIPMVFTLGHYGQTAALLVDGGLQALVPDSLYAEDCRGYISVLGILQQMFCEARYKFRSPYLESEAGRRLWMYLAGPYFYKNGISYWGAKVNFRAEFIGTVEIPFWTSTSGKIPFNNTSLSPNYNAGDTWIDAVLSPGFDGNSSWFVNPRPFTHEFTFEFGINALNGDMVLPISMEIIIELMDEDDIIYDSKLFIYDIEPGGKKILQGTWDTNVYRGGKAYVRSNFGAVLTGSWFKGTVRGKYHYLGDNVEIAATLADIKQLEVLRGIISTLNGKIDVKEAEKEVWLHIPDDVDIVSTLGVTSVEGYYRKYEYDDATPYMVPNSLKFSSEEPSFKRFLRLKFKDSDDPSVPEDQKETLHSHLIDFGPGLDDTDEDKVENTLFSPTIDVILPVTTYESQDGLWVPSLRDTDEPQLSVNPGFRILSSQGFVSQTRRQLPEYHADAGDFDVVKFNFEQYEPKSAKLGGNATMFLYLSQKPVARLWPIGNRGIGNVVYGDTSNDLYQLFWQRELSERNPNNIMQALFTWDRTTALRFSFRRQQMLYHKGQPLLLRPTAIKDIDMQRDIPLLVEFTKGGCLPTFAPCGCARTTARFYQHYSDEGGEHNPLNTFVTFFEVDGVQYVLPGAYPGLGAANIITLNGFDYATNLVDALNSLNIPHFTFTYRTAGGSITSDDRKYWFEISYPSCQRFTIMLQEIATEEVNKWLYTEEGVWKWNPDQLYWTQDRDVFVPNYHTPINIVKTQPARPCDIC
jgi:hypothetical protein